MEPVRFALLAALCLWASVCDLQKRLVPDRISAALLVLGLPGVDLSSVCGLLLTFLPLLAVAVFTDGGLGGGDVKFSAAVGFVLRGANGVLGVLLGCLLAVVLVPIWRKIKGRPMNEGFPLIPFISAGCLAAGLCTL